MTTLALAMLDIVRPGQGGAGDELVLLACAAVVLLGVAVRMRMNSRAVSSFTSFDYAGAADKSRAVAEGCAAGAKLLRGEVRP